MLISLIALVTIALTGSGFAGEKIVFPSMGVINTDSVNLRAGSSTNFEIMGQLDTGDRVMVLGKLKGWYKIEPPKGVAFWVARPFIRKGRVACNRLNVRARPTTRSTVVCQLNYNDLVRRVGERGDWMAIAPPECAAIWVSSELIDLKPGVQIREMPAQALRTPVISTPEPIATIAAEIAEVEEEGVERRVEEKAPEVEALEGLKVPAVYEGILKGYEKVGVSGYDHCLEKGFLFKRVICLIRSDRVDLPFHVNDRVEVWGYRAGETEEGIPMLEVHKLEVE